MVRRTKSCSGTSVGTKALSMIGMVVVVVIALTLAPAVLAAPEGMSETQQPLQDDHRENYPSLACDPTTSATGKEFESREGMELEIEMAPSQAPSMSMPCSDPYSNTRGVYTSYMAPCVITFHNEDKEVENQIPSNLNPIAADHRIKEYPNLSLFYHGTSSVCGTETAISEAKEYVSAWPDECVGDFARCYDLDDPNHLMCPALTKLLKGLRDQRRLEATSPSGSGIPGTTADLHDQDDFYGSFHDDINALIPPFTTHISVDCTLDKEAILESYEQQSNLQHERIRETVSAQKEGTLFAVLSVLGAMLIILFAISHLVVQPIVGAIGEAFARRRSFEGGLGGESDEFVSLVTHNSGLHVENDVDESGHVEADHQMEHQMEEDLPLDETEQHFLDSSPHHQIPMDFDAVPIQISMDFDAVPIQLPMDFDAVPIVPATLVPIEAIHAEVVQDGVAYYQ